MVSRFACNPITRLGDPASRTDLLEITLPTSFHHGGTLAFGPDRMLYVAVGDGGPEEDPNQNSQNPHSLLGKVLRLDTSQPGALPEVWASGLRAPWRFSFDRETGDLWLGDVGQDRREEIDVIQHGGNYGWNVFEGSLPFKGGPARGQYTLPVWEYDHKNIGFSGVTGGVIYRGRQFPELRGNYLFGDYGPGLVWAMSVAKSSSTSIASNLLSADFRVVTPPRLISQVSQVVAFCEDLNNEIYAVNLFGTLWRLERSPTGAMAPQLPVNLSQTGLFDDTERLIPRMGMLPYEVNSPLWSDGAEKKHWLWFPTGSEYISILINPSNCPVGTVLAKEFEMNVGFATPASRIAPSGSITNRDGPDIHISGTQPGPTRLYYLTHRMGSTSHCFSPMAA